MYTLFFVICQMEAVNNPIRIRYSMSLTGPVAENTKSAGPLTVINGKIDTFRDSRFQVVVTPEVQAERCMCLSMV